MNEERLSAPAAGRNLWRDADFLKFWSGEAISLFGMQVTLLALPLIAVLVFEVGPEQVGLLRALELIPFLLLALPLGVWVDRVRRRPVMILANASRAVLIGLIPILYEAGQLHLSVLYVIAFLVGIGAVLFDVSWMSYIPVLVRERQQLMAANSRLAATHAAADVAGPGIGGVLVQVLTAPVALAVNAVSYAVSVVTLLAIRTPEPPPPDRADRRSLGAELRDGLRWVFGNPLLRTVTLLGAAYNFFFTFVQTVFLVYAIRTIGLSPGILGLVLSFGGIGGLLGASFAGRLTRLAPIGRVYLCAAVVAFVAPVLIPLAGGPELATIAVLCFAFGVGTAGIGVANVVGISLRQTVTPPRLMARMNAAVRTLLYGLGAAGAPAGGYIAVALGLRPALVVAAVGSVLVMLPVFRSSVVALRALPEPAVATAHA
jgi:MFS family permease